jgi:hypothetical protein
MHEHPSHHGGFRDLGESNGRQNQHRDVRYIGNIEAHTSESPFFCARRISAACRRINCGLENARLRTSLTTV